MAVFVPLGCAAQNRVLNGDFGGSLSGWTVSAGDGRGASWNTDDSQANSASGSAELRHAGAPTGFPVMVLRQCVSLSGMPAGTTPFGLRSKSLQESAGIVQAHAALAFFRDYGCADLLAPGPTYALALNSPNWTSEHTDFDRDINANSLLIELGLSRSIGSGSAGAVRFDDLYIGSAGVGPLQVTLKRWSADAGGGFAGAGVLGLAASIGQPDAGNASAGAISVQGGFWYASMPTAPAPTRIFGNGFESP